MCGWKALDDTVLHSQFLSRPIERRLGNGEGPCPVLDRLRRVPVPVCELLLKQLTGRVTFVSAPRGFPCGLENVAGTAGAHSDFDDAAC